MDAAADCHNPVCGSKADMFRNSMGGGQKKPPPGAAPKRGAKDEGKQHEGSAVTAASATMPCPADREELGRQSWTLVRVALAYPLSLTCGVHLVSTWWHPSCVPHNTPCPSHCLLIGNIYRRTHSSKTHHFLVPHTTPSRRTITHTSQHGMIVALHPLLIPPSTRHLPAPSQLAPHDGRVLPKQAFRYAAARRQILRRRLVSPVPVHALRGGNARHAGGEPRHDGLARKFQRVDVPDAQHGERTAGQADLSLHDRCPRREMADGPPRVLGGSRRRQQRRWWRQRASTAGQ